jgi:hypothetical protein
MPCCRGKMTLVCVVEVGESFITTIQMIITKVQEILKGDNILLITKAIMKATVTEARTSRIRIIVDEMEIIVAGIVTKADVIMIKERVVEIIEIGVRVVAEAVRADGAKETIKKRQNMKAKVSAL